MIEAVVADLGSVICYFKSGQLLLLQIGAELLQIGAAITNRGNYYKSVHSKCDLNIIIRNTH